MTLNEIFMKHEVEAVRLEIERTITRFIMDHNSIEYDNCLRDYGMLPREYRKELEKDFVDNFEVCVDTIMDLNSYLNKYEIRIERRKKK